MFFIIFIGLIVSFLTVLVFHLFKQNENISKLAKQNERIMEMLEQQLNETIRLTCESDDEDDEDLPLDYVLPYSSDDSDDEMKTKGFHFENTTVGLTPPLTVSSEYSTQWDVDPEWETFRVVNAPKGPVPDDQVRFVTSCPLTEFYVKGIVQNEIVHIVTYESTNLVDFQWKPTVCKECIKKVIQVFEEGGNEFPFALDGHEEEEDSNQGPSNEEVSNTLEKKENGLVDLEAQRIIKQEKMIEEIFGVQEKQIEKPSREFEFDFSSNHLVYDYDDVVLF